jgi:DNA-binding transcriptional LysR family regulator
MIVNTGSVRGAAELLGLSPGALSKSMKQLENELDQTLLTMSGRNIKVTDAGMKLYGQSQNLLNEYDRFVQVVENNERGPSCLRVSSYGGYISYCLAEIAKSLKNTGVSAIFRLPGAIEQSILRDEADVGLTHIPFPDPNLEHIKLVNFNMLLIQKPGTFNHLPIEEIPLVVPHPQPGGDVFHFQTFEGWPVDKFNRRRQFTTESVEFALDLCRKGLAALFAPKYIIQLHNEVVKDEYRLAPMALPEDFTPVRHELYLIKKKTMPSEGLINVFTEEMVRICSPD